MRITTIDRQICVMILPGNGEGFDCSSFCEIVLLQRKGSSIVPDRELERLREAREKAVIKY